MYDRLKNVTVWIETVNTRAILFPYVVRCSKNSVWQTWIWSKYSGHTLKSFGGISVLAETKNSIDDPRRKRNREKKVSNRNTIISNKGHTFFSSISSITMRDTNKSTTSELFYLLIACILSCPGFRALERHWWLLQEKKIVHKSLFGWPCDFSCFVFWKEFCFWHELHE